MNSSNQYRELTFSAVFLGIIQGVILNIAFVYAALTLGFSIGGSTVAAIIGYGLLRGVMKKGTIVENNINQTIASGINTAGTGVVFTLPALFMLDAKMRADTGIGLLEEEGNWLPLLGSIMLGGVAGSILGVILIIPLRKQMIALDRLRFPSGVAVAEILKTGGTSLSKFRLLLIGVVVSGVWKLILATGIVDKPGLLMHDELNISFGVIPDQFAPVLYLSLMNVAAGLLSGKGGVPFFIGGVLAWWIISPMAVQLGWIDPTSLSQLAEFREGAIANGTEVFGLLHGDMIRPLGIGTLIGGALMGVVAAFPAIKSAFVSLASAAKSNSVGEQYRWR